MLKKNKLVMVFLSLLLCMGLFTGCSSGATSKQSDQKRVVCTIFPEYDWARELIGDLDEHYDLTLLLDNGSDMHSYQPSAKDIAVISACDVFIYLGGESDQWVEDALKEAANKNMQIINLMEVFGDSVKEEELVEGMEGELHEEENAQGDRHEEYDEHLWLSLKNAKVAVEAIAEALKAVDEENAEILDQNLALYIDKLSILDAAYETAVENGKHNMVLFADRFPFRYMVDDYQLAYYAAFPGCSAETEASFDTIVFLAGKLDEFGLSNVLVLENSDQKIAQTIINNTKDKQQKILVMDSMQSTTTKDSLAGDTYLSIMESNLQVLKQALN